MPEAFDTGIITKSTGGFYYVRTGDNTLHQCRARGLFRKENLKPCVGDHCKIQLTPGADGSVVDISPRKNVLIRPPLANIDQMALVVSMVDPAPNLAVLDKFLSILEFKGIAPFLVFTKTDLSQPDELAEAYALCGFDVCCVSSTTGQGVEAVQARLAGKLTAFAGNSGVGKSSLLNALDPRLGIETGETSKKLGRGRHTTRHVELFEVAGGLVADTPGFSAMELSRMEVIFKEELAECFREFAAFLPECRFADCAHLAETGCGVAAAVQAGKIPASRHQSYKQLYAELAEIPDHVLKKARQRGSF